jgi:hypothetical protein
MFLAAASAWGGNLNPSAPPTAGTMKPLTDIEPRTAVQSLRGFAYAVYVISQPGSYYLTGGITVTEVKHAISIEASNVSLDLCGFTLTGAYVTTNYYEGAFYDGINVKPGCRNVIIRNGIIEGARMTVKFGSPPLYQYRYTLPFSRGIAAEWDLSVTPRVMSTAIQVCDVVVRGSRGTGIFLKGKGHFVSGCMMENNEGPGIHAGYPSTVHGNHQSENGDNMLIVRAGAFAYQNVSLSDWSFLPTYAVAKYETTNAEYGEFLNEFDPQGEYWYSAMEIQRSGSAGAYLYTVTAGREAYPIVYVSTHDAAAFAAWKSHATGRSYRLPTEQEWEKAAGWDPVERKLYTYGFHRDTIDATWCNYNLAYGGPLPVGSFNGTGGKNDAKSYYGCYDMSGNLWEWTSSLYDTTMNRRVLRGGSWNYDANACRVAYRNYDTPGYRDFYGGFRLVLDLE